MPFFLFGWVMGRALGSGSAPASIIYAADLLGAGVGAAVSYVLLDRLGGFATVFALSALCFASAVTMFSLSAGYTDRQRRQSRSVGLVTGIVLLVAVPLGIWLGAETDAWRLDFTGMKGVAPDKTIVGTLKGKPDARVIRTEWDSFARTDTVSTSDESRRIMFVDGGAGSYMYKFNGDLGSVAGLARDIEFLPFAAGPADKSIIVGAGGGRDILYTLMAGAKEVTAVELSPGLVKSMRAFADYNGSILDRQGVHTVIGDGRSVLERSRESYDLIVLDLVYSQVGGIGGQALAENYVFTREAFATYLQRLNPNGRIIIISHQGIEGIRAYYTGFESLLRTTGGKPGDVARHTALLMAPEGSASPNLTMSIIQKSPLTQQQLQLLKAGTQSLGLNALFLPNSNEQLLKPLLNGKTGFDQFVRDSEYNVYPTTDDKPFFFQVEQSLPVSLHQWFIVIALLSVLFAFFLWRQEIAPQLLSVRAGSTADGGRTPIPKRFGAMSYYILLGIGYMCIQTAIIQKTMIYAGGPVLAAIVVIVTMLLGGSLGSGIAGRFKVSVLVAVIAVIVLTIGLIMLDFLLGDRLIALGTITRMAVIGIAIFLLGILLGIPLPAGLRTEERRAQGSSPLFFAVNGIAGVWGSWLAITVSVTSGLTITLAIGCLCYAVIVFERIIRLRRLKHERIGTNES
ncbi:hypothetical protein [Paenibacillus sp. yr247]|uniref:hypothetical protein n=1 Tax=Paenibacillus sp. yr247 TaxID=1761880 RepID=UPI001587C7F6|nr:hypothetical protein [Paenibacillus sp. yr247]